MDGAFRTLTAVRRGSGNVMRVGGPSAAKSQTSWRCLGERKILNLLWAIPLTVTLAACEDGSNASLGCGTPTTPTKPTAQTHTLREALGSGGSVSDEGDDITCTADGNSCSASYNAGGKVNLTIRTMPSPARRATAVAPVIPPCSARPRR